jgi:hypothetical protein
LDKNGLGHILGDFFSKLNRSPWPQTSIVRQRFLLHVEDGKNGFEKWATIRKKRWVLRFDVDIKITGGQSVDTK